MNPSRQGRLRPYAVTTILACTVSILTQAQDSPYEDGSEVLDGQRKQNDAKSYLVPLRPQAEDPRSTWLRRADAEVRFDVGGDTGGHIMIEGRALGSIQPLRDTSDANWALENVTAVLAANEPVLGDLSGLELVIDKISAFDDVVEVWFHQVIGGIRVPQSRIIAGDGINVSMIQIDYIDPASDIADPKSWLTREVLEELAAEVEGSAYARENKGNFSDGYLMFDLDPVTKRFRPALVIVINGKEILIDAITGETLRVNKATK